MVVIPNKGVEVKAFERWMKGSGLSGTSTL
jgi:hypothetical protein